MATDFLNSYDPNAGSSGRGSCIKLRELPKLVSNLQFSDSLR